VGGGGCAGAPVSFFVLVLPHGSFHLLPRNNIVIIICS